MRRPNRANGQDLWFVVELLLFPLAAFFLNRFVPSPFGKGLGRGFSACRNPSRRPSHEGRGRCTKVLTREQPFPLDYKRYRVRPPRIRLLRSSQSVPALPSSLRCWFQLNNSQSTRRLR